MGIHSNSDPKRPKLTIVLGEGDIGVGFVDKKDLDPDHAAVGLVPLEKKYKPGENIENWDQDPALCIYLICKGERGLASLRRIVAHCAKELGYENTEFKNEESIGFNIVTNLMDELGELKEEVKELKAELARREEQAKIELEQDLKTMMEDNNEGSN